MVFELAIGPYRIVVFGDTVLMPGAWDSIIGPDLALIPIGGEPTMTADEAANVVAAMRPRLVIPCHYDCPALFRRDDARSAQICRTASRPSGRAGEPRAILRRPHGITPGQAGGSTLRLTSERQGTVSARIPDGDREIEAAEHHPTRDSLFVTSRAHSTGAACATNHKKISGRPEGRPDT